jgi:glyoxylase-like metal-dependent hydrolase (beta-lactamase superfamily II)
LLPASIQVIVRDWFCCNQILLSGNDGTVLIDSGHVTRAGETLDLLQSALGTKPVQRLINTHCHSDHMGGNAAIERRYGCPISVPAGEAPLIERWDTRALWLDWAGQQAERFSYDDTLAPGTVFEAGGLEWQTLAAPGHDAAALVFWSEEERVLISGDALWEHGFGIVLDEPPGGLQQARATLATLAALNARVVIPGHGVPFSNVSAALERSFARLEAMQADPRRAARSALKAMLAFTLLDRHRLDLAQLPGLLDNVPFYREYNARYFQLSGAQLAELLVKELERSGAARRENGWLVPAAAHE